MKKDDITCMSWRKTLIVLNTLKGDEFTIDENRFTELLDRLNSIDWKRKS